MLTKMYLVGLLQAALVLGVLAQNEYSKDENQYGGEKATQSSKGGPYLNSEAPAANVYDATTTTKKPYTVDSYSAPEKSSEEHKDGDYHSGMNRRDVRDGTTFKPSSTESVPSTNSSFGFNRHRRESPTLKPLFPSTSTESENAPSTLKPHSQHRRDLSGFTSESSSSSTTERESRFFVTRAPVDVNGTTTTRRSFFNRNRRDTSDEATTKKSPHFHLGGEEEQEEAKEATKFPRINQESSSTHSPKEEEVSSTTRRFGIGRFRRNSHEFPPEDEEQGGDHSGHNHPSTPASSATTKKVFHTRAQRSVPEEDLFEKRTSTEQSSSTRGGHPVFHLGHSDEESSSTERQAALNPGGRFRRSDDFGSPQGFLFNRPAATASSTQEPPTFGTKESSESTTTRQFGGFFRN